MDAFKREIEITDAFLKNKMEPKHVVAAEKYMDKFICDPRVDIGTNEVTCLLSLLYKDYLCYLIAEDNRELLGDLMWQKMDQYEWSYKNRIEKLEKLYNNQTKGEQLCQKI